MEFVFSETSEMYETELEGIIFEFEEKPEEDIETQLQSIADNYHKNIEHIIEHILPDLEELYGDVNKEEVEEKLGTPYIDIDVQTITYLEQEFDDDAMHIFMLEYMDDTFEELGDFSIDG